MTFMQFTPYASTAMLPKRFTDVSPRNIRETLRGDLTMPSSPIAVQNEAPAADETNLTERGFRSARAPIGMAS